MGQPSPRAALHPCFPPLPPPGRQPPLDIEVLGRPPAHVPGKVRLGKTEAWAWKGVGPGWDVHLCAPLEICFRPGVREGDKEGKPQSPSQLPSAQAGLDETPGAGSGELSEGPGGRAGVPMTPESPHCLSHMTWFSTGYLKDAVREGRGTCWESSVLDDPCTLLMPMAPGQPLCGTHSTLQLGRWERRVGRDCLCSVPGAASLHQAKA